MIQNKDPQVLRESTSGGVFTAIAKTVIRKGGIVFGAGFDTKGVVHHQAVEKEEDLRIFRNSKYVQREIGDTFKEIKKHLQEGKWVAMSSTPCQIEALIHYLRKPYEKLLLIDVVCYSIPSPGIFANYLTYMQSKIGGKFNKILFREKRLYYNYTSFSLFNEKPELDYHKGVESDQFMRSFFSDMNVRPSCYNCRFKMFSNDFDDNGTNRILVHTGKGMSILDAIKDSVRLEEYKNLDYFIADEIAMVKSVPMNPKRADFFKDYQTMEFGAFINKWFPTTFKVRLNSFLRKTAFRLGIYNESKRIVKKILGKN